MQKYLIVLLSIALLPPWVGFAPPMEAAQAPPAGDNLTSQELKQRALDAYMKMPLYFVANQGQVDESVAYYAQGSGHSIYFTAEEVVVALKETTLRMRFVGANATQPVGAERTAARVNYFIGDDPAKWQTDIPTYGQVVYHDLYPGIDLRYEGQTGALKYTFEAQPGADVSKIRLAFGGAAGLRLDEAGNLLILAGGSELKDTKPYAYQEIGGRRVEVDVAFVLHGVRTCGFAVRGGYDPRYPLIIDPTLLYSTYLGGSDDDRGFGIAVDGAGHAYVTGWTESTDFPTQNPYDNSLGGSRDAFVTELNATGNALLHSTYLGGSGDGIGFGIAVDGVGHTYVTGYIDSTDFPTTTNAYQGTYGGGDLDAFVAKLALPVQSTIAFINQAGEAVNGYYVGGGIYVTVKDPDENKNHSTQESVNVTVSDATTGDSETLTLTETGNSTGIFRNTTALPSSSNATGTPGNGILETQPGHTIKVSYTDPDDSADKSSDTATMLALGSSLTAFTDADGGEVNGYLISADPIYVTVIDADENTNPAGRQAVSAIISDTNTGDSETLALLETGDDTGQFRNTMGLSSTDSATGTPGNGALETKVGHIIGASYTDDDDSSDKSSDTAAITSLFNVHLPAIMKGYAPFCNGDFEQGASCWSFGGMERHAVSTAMPYSGTQSALLGGDKGVYGCEGGVPQGSAWMEQTFNVPNEGSPKLSFWYRLYSYDKTKERARVDSFEVKVNGATVFEDLLTWATAYGCDKPPNDGGWQQVTLDLSAYKGQTITLHFEVWNRADNWYNTWAYIDDVRME